MLTFKMILAIIISVKRYSFNPLYNPYILIIYTPLNEKRPYNGRFSCCFLLNSFTLPPAADSANHKTCQHKENDIRR